MAGVTGREIVEACERGDVRSLVEAIDAALAAARAAARAEEREAIIALVGTGSTLSGWVRDVVKAKPLVEAIRARSEDAT